MKSNSQSGSPTAHSNAPAAPSVPLAVYKELAAELQATRAMVDSLNTKNQQLAQQNQQLCSEVGQLVQSALNLQQWMVVSGDAPRTSHPSQPTDIPDPTYAEAATASAIAAKLRPSEPLSDELFTEQPSRPQRISQTKRPKDLGGLWLLLTVLAIVLTAFGAGFLIMRPFLQTSR